MAAHPLEHPGSDMGISKSPLETLVGKHWKSRLLTLEVPPTHLASITTTTTTPIPTPAATTMTMTVMMTTPTMTSTLPQKGSGNTTSRPSYHRALAPSPTDPNHTPTATHPRPSAPCGERPRKVTGRDAEVVPLIFLLVPSYHYQLTGTVFVQKHKQI